MQADYKQIYKMAALKNGEEEQLYKDLGNFVFSALYTEMRKPSKLILKLRGVGRWHLRKKRMQTILEMFPLDHEWYASNDFSEYTLFKYENRKEIHEIFKQRLKDYDEYLEKRDEVRKERHVTQTLLIPINKDDERFKST